MKSINQILKTNSLLMEEPEVMELIDYCKDLEDQVVEYKQKKEQTIILKQLISEINRSCFELLEEDKKNERWEDFEKVDFKESIINLRGYIIKYCYDNKIEL
jgi:hypothetical protein